MKIELEHSGVKGMKWGYNDGVRNGKRTAQDDNSLVITDDTTVMVRDGQIYFSQPDGSYQTAGGDVYREKNVDDWLSSTLTQINASNLDSRQVVTTKNIGKIERGIKNFIDKGTKFLERLFD